MIIGIKIEMSGKILEISIENAVGSFFVNSGLQLNLAYNLGCFKYSGMILMQSIKSKSVSYEILTLTLYARVYMFNVPIFSEHLKQTQTIL